MNRYIDAEKFEKEMYHEAFETDSDMQKWDRGCWIRYKMFENCIAQQPTAEVVEVVHGEWEEVDKRVKGQKFICSVCKKASYFPQPTRDKSWTKKCPYNYCPNCGAKMDGKKVE